ncbi:hypothetical protein D3C86_2205390 [compost metagenome]
MFIAALLTEVIIVIMGRADVVAYLWLNVIGCLLVVIISLIIQQIINTGKTSKLKADEKL